MIEKIAQHWINYTLLICQEMAHWYTHDAHTKYLHNIDCINPVLESVISPNALQEILLIISLHFTSLENLNDLWPKPLLKPFLDRAKVRICVCVLVSSFQFRPCKSVSSFVFSWFGKKYQFQIESGTLIIKFRLNEWSAVAKWHYSHILHMPEKYIGKMSDMKLEQQNRRE